MLQNSVRNEKQRKDIILSTHLQYSSWSTDLTEQAKKISCSAEVKESFENNRPASRAAVAEATYLRKSSIQHANQNLFAQLNYSIFTLISGTGYRI